VEEVDWGTVTAIGALVAASVGYLSRQMNRLEDRLTARIDHLTERYIAHLERHAP
jgi:hypothetical protein